MNLKLDFSTIKTTYKLQKPYLFLVLLPTFVHTIYIDIYLHK